MHDTHTLLESRAQRILAERVQRHVETPVQDLQVAAFQVTDDPARPGQGEPVAFAQALHGTFEPFQIGSAWGPAWGTTWFRMTGRVPAEPAGSACHYELHVDLGWEDHSPGFQAEGLVYRPDGTVIKAINPRNMWIPLDQAVPSSGATGAAFDSDPVGAEEASLSDHAGVVASSGAAGDTFTLYIEAAANPLILGVPPFQPTDLGDKETSPATPIYRLKAAEIVRVNDQVRGLAFDLSVLTGLVHTLPEDDQSRLRLTHSINDAINLLDLDDVEGSAPAVRAALKPLLDAPALPGLGTHHITAVGHAHIDSAWLWPVRETRRKVVRTLANVLRLLDDGADMVFALPAAQHVAWLEQDAPEVFARVQAWVKKGLIVPVGGMWVEPDAMLPGGEALCRQLIEGQKYFQHAFGVTCDGVWLPDSFGYSAALPQIATLGGARWFLTQKISWNQTDVFPHHTLLWEGIDGTRLFTHFPPADTYGAEVTPAELHHAATNFKDRARADSSMLLYGYGDGGGGPTRDMLERLTRMRNVQGLPTLETGTPDAFFDRAMAKSDHLPIWVGELYLELHRGTLTSQAGVKLGNRQAEAALRVAETWAATAAVASKIDYPYDELQELWRSALLLQFHDILPGSSVAWVYRDQQRMHADIIRRAQAITQQACQALGAGLYFNAAPVDVRGIAPFGASAQLAPVAETSCVQGDGWTLTNGTVTARIARDGRVTSLVGADGRETVPPGEELGQLWIYQDFPNMWDAWDVDQFYRESGHALTADRVEAGPDQVSAHFTFGHSTATVTWTLPAETSALQATVSVDWHESEKLLKLQLPLDVHTDHAEYETQMGYLTRPIHENTTWDANRFEVAAHRWVHVGEGQWGVGVTNQATYGWSHQRLSRPGGGTYAVLGASLLRASKFPDPHQDQGQHTRSFRIVPGASIADTQRAAYQMDLPLVHAGGSPAGDRVEAAGGDQARRNPAAETAVAAAVTRDVETADTRGAGDAALNAETSSAGVTPLVTATGLTVEAIKLAEDRSGDVIIRGYEPSGTRHAASVTFNVPVTGAHAVTLLETVEFPGRAHAEDPAQASSITLAKDTVSAQPANTLSAAEPGPADGAKLAQASPLADQVGNQPRVELPQVTLDGQTAHVQVGPFQIVTLRATVA